MLEWSNLCNGHPAKFFMYNISTCLHSPKTEKGNGANSHVNCQ